MEGHARQFSRRRFIGTVSSFGVLCGPKMFGSVAATTGGRDVNSRVSELAIVDGGFASIRKVTSGIYATIADPTKGSQATSNGGFLVGKEAAFLIEGFNSVAGASFQMSGLRKISPVSVRAALNTHFHYDHSMGNSFYGANGIPIWAHKTAAERMFAAYSPMQGVKEEAVLAPLLERVREAKTELERLHAQSDVSATIEIFNSANASLLALPDHPLDPSKLPVTLDLGGLKAELEFHPGHSGTDIVVRVPEQNVLFTGDLLFNGKYPVCFDPDVTISGWRQTLNKFAALDKDTIFIPGHGPVCGQEGISAVRDVFDDIVSQAEHMFHAGIPIIEAQHRYVVPVRFKTLPIWSWGFTIGSAIVNLYEEWNAPKS